MKIDNISFSDISIFHQEEEFSIFHKLNFTRTIGGKEWLVSFLQNLIATLKRSLVSRKSSAFTGTCERLASGYF